MSSIKLTSEQIVTLADAHIDMYQGRIDSGHPTVRIDETSQLRNLWSIIKHETLAKLSLSSYQENEVIDAILSGEYNELLSLTDEIDIEEITFPYPRS